MELIVDLHIHSHYSRACSQNMNVASLYRWGKIKGINVIGSGDFTHPLWFEELRTKLEPAEPGLFKLKDEFAREEDKLVPASCRNNFLRFILTVEISNIYSKNGKVRKLHNLVIMPSFEAVAKFNASLQKIGNLKADGRPILGLDSKELLRIALQSSPVTLFIPAHIWTPWFAMFGSRSGFDSISEAFEDLSGEIKAVETGLSSDPYMNWRLDELRSLTLVSNSDAHSALKLGREANLLNCEPGYQQIVNAIKTGSKDFIGTIEFFPEEGKYHHDGHRLCKVNFTPEETAKYKGLCPVCGKPLVIGVLSRVGSLADKPSDFHPLQHKRVEYIIPLCEMIAETRHSKGANSKGVMTEYEKLYTAFGNEFAILRSVPTADIASAGFVEIAEAIKRLRAGQVHVEAGYDGVFGVVKVFAGDAEKRSIAGQFSLSL